MHNLFGSVFELMAQRNDQLSRFTLWAQFAPLLGRGREVGRGDSKKGERETKGRRGRRGEEEKQRRREESREEGRDGGKGRTDGGSGGAGGDARARHRPATATAADGDGTAIRQPQGAYAHTQ